MAELKSVSAAKKGAKRKETYDPSKRCQNYREEIEHDGKNSAYSKCKQLLIEERMIECHGFKYHFNMK